MLIQRYVMGFFWSNSFEMSRNIRTGNFDFLLAQPGNPLFMVSTRKLDPDSLANSFRRPGGGHLCRPPASPPPGATDLGSMPSCCSADYHSLQRARDLGILTFWTTAARA